MSISEIRALTERGYITASLKGAVLFWGRIQKVKKWNAVSVLAILHADGHKCKVEE